MQKTILTAFASVLLAGSMIPPATAGEYHHARRANRMVPVLTEPYRDPYAYDFRNAYGWTYPDYAYWQSRLEGGAISAPAGH